MKKIYLYAIAFCALTACGNKAEKASGEEAKKDSVTKVEEVKDAPVATEAQTVSNLGMESLTKQSWPVKGGVSVKNFVKALLPGTHEYYADEPEAVDRFFTENSDFITLDEKNGYMLFSQEGGGWGCIECCYWKRTDGSILVAYVEDSHGEEMVGDDLKFVKESSINFFVYNKEQNVLEPICASFDVKVGKGEHICWDLPQKGKDIGYTISADDDPQSEGKDFVLKFDGMGFK